MGRIFQKTKWKNQKKADHATRVLLVFFLLVIGLGTLLLGLPVSSRNGVSCGGMVALFTATSCTCVTGLSLVDTYTQWSGFGQAVILCLIQIGGLGYMTFISVAFFLLRRKIGLRERLIIQQAMALNELDGVVKLVKIMVFGTFLVEGIGAVILTARFALEFPFMKALWLGVFHSVSAYCNAGFDILGFIEPGASLLHYGNDPVIILTISGLIVISGLGFFVWNDIMLNKRFKKFSVHTKLVLLITLGLVFGGAIVLALLEWYNPKTLGAMSFGEKCMAALFQSVTTRTAGFAAIPQDGLTESSLFVSTLLMFVGGSSGSTAGGIKTVTVGILLLEAMAVVRNRKDVVVFGRRISETQLRNALSICLLVVLLGFGGAIVIAATNGVPLWDAIYETVSAICTVGLSTGITASLNTFSKLLLILYMIFGRVGLMTISFAFMTKSPPDNAIRRPETRVLIG